MSKKLLISMLSVLLLSAFSFAQTIVSPGDGTLSQAIAAAQDGDVLQLVPGGEYTESTLFSLGELHKAITIEPADPTSTDKAIVTITSNDGSSTPNFFSIGDSGSITLNGIEFDGNQGGTPTVSHLVQVVVGTTTDSGFVHMIKVENCLVHDLTGGVVDASNSSVKGIMVVDSVFVDNCVFHNTSTSVYMKYAGCDYVQVTNSTFYNIDSYGMRVSGPGESTWYNHTAAGYVDHTTWYNVGISDPREIILLEKGPNQNPWLVQNSIFEKQTSDSKTVINIKDLVDTLDSHVNNICMWQIGALNWRGGVIKDTVTMDPQFADAANGDFTLPSGSTLLTYGSDGKAIGDPRWATNAPTAVDGQQTAQPLSYSLNQNYPNPFNPSTSISFTLKKSGMTTLEVYNILGSRVATLINRNLSAGEHNVNFNAVNLTSGVYIYKLSSNNVVLTRKMVLLK